MRLGVDLGTTWTAAAIHTEGGCEAVQLAQQTIAMPSVVALVDGDIVVGEAAERRLAADPAAGVREFKRRLGDSTPYVLGGGPYGAEALMGHLLRHVVETAASQAGQRPETITLTHPANWGEFKLDLLREAGRVAGVEHLELMAEPEAAARHYANLGRLEPGQAVAVFDFGGGTFDAAVVRNGENGPELLGTPEGLERLGGVDVDHAVLAHVDAALDGQLRELDTTDPAVRTALARLRAECTAAKEALSSDTETSIHVAVPGIDTHIRVSRVELEQVVRPRMVDMVGALERAVASSGVPMDDLTGVLMVGGSSRMPAVAELVAAATGLPTLIDADPKLVVAAGAAWPLGAIVAPSGDATREESGPAAGPAGSPGVARPAAKPTERSARLRQAVSILGATAAAGAAVVGGYAGFRAFWDDDGDGGGGAPETGAAADEDAAALLVAGIAEEMIAEIDAEMAPGDDSLDAFDAVAAPPSFSGGAAPRPAMADDDGPSFVPPPRPSAPMATPSRDAGRPHHDVVDRPSPPPMAEPRPSGPSATTKPADLFSDPELETVRTQLRERIAKLQLPEGTDAADATDLRGDLEGLLDRFRPYPGQSLDDAVASLRYEFEDRVRDFAQDRRIEVLIEQQREETAKPAETMPTDAMPTDTMPTAETTAEPPTDTMPTAEMPSETTAEKPTDATPADTMTQTPTDTMPMAEMPSETTAEPGSLTDVFDEEAPTAPGGMEPALPVGDSPPPSTHEPAAPAATPAVTTTMPDPAPTPPPMDDVLGTDAVEVAVATTPMSAPAPAAETPPAETATVDMAQEPAPSESPDMPIAAMPQDDQMDDPVAVPEPVDDWDDDGAELELELEQVEPLADPLGV